MEPLEQSLAAAYASWRPALELGTMEGLSEATRISASFHPEYHFLESYLHTLRGYRDNSIADFTRAIVLDHVNENAIAAKAALEAGAQLPPFSYHKARTNLHEWGQRVEVAAVSIHALLESDLDAAIALCDETHRQFHRLAALPWLARAQRFSALGERELAANDCRRGLDLDRQNAELQDLLKQTA